MLWAGEGGSDSDKKGGAPKFSQEGTGEKVLYQRG